MMAITDFPWFKVYAAETLSDENFSSWGLAERGAWFTLLCHCWKEGSIPSDIGKLARLCSCNADAMHEVWMGIADRFHEHQDTGRLVCLRLEFERQKSLKESDGKSQHGKKAADARWGKYKLDMLGQCSGITHAMPNDAPQPQPQPQIKDNPIPLPRKTRRVREAKVKVLGDYPPEMHEAVEKYKGLMRDCRSDEVLNLYPEEKRFMAKQAGSVEATWKAWTERKGSIVRGSEVTDQDMLAAVDRLIQARGYNATKGLGLNVPMLPTLINSDVFVDALVKVKEVTHAS